MRRCFLDGKAINAAGPEVLGEVEILKGEVKATGPALHVAPQHVGELGLAEQWGGPTGGHDRIASWRCWAVGVENKGLVGLEGWHELRTVCMVEYDRFDGEETTTERRY